MLKTIWNVSKDWGASRINSVLISTQASHDTLSVRSVSCFVLPGEAVVKDDLPIEFYAPAMLRCLLSTAMSIDSIIFTFFLFLLLFYQQKKIFFSSIL